MPRCARLHSYTIRHDTPHHCHGVTRWPPTHLVHNLIVSSLQFAQTELAPHHAAMPLTALAGTATTAAYSQTRMSAQQAQPLVKEQVPSQTTHAFFCSTSDSCTFVCLRDAACTGTTFTNDGTPCQPWTYPTAGDCPAGHDWSAGSASTDSSCTGFATYSHNNPDRVHRGI